MAIKETEYIFTLEEIKEAVQRLWDWEGNLTKKEQTMAPAARKRGSALAMVEGARVYATGKGSPRDPAAKEPTKPRIWIPR